MRRHCVLTGIGRDRHGLAEEVSEFIVERGGSVDVSYMVNLNGYFAFVVLIAGSETAAAAITSDMHLLEARSSVQTRAVLVDRLPTETGDNILYRLTGSSLDQAGLVHNVADALRQLEINIETMETRTEQSPFTGTTIFSMNLLIAAPAEVALTELHRELGRTCDPLNIDWLLTEALPDDRESLPCEESKRPPWPYTDHGWGPSN
jgi:glycine cleavage system transcriptional repressor